MTREDLEKLKGLSNSIQEFVKTIEEFISTSNSTKQNLTVINQVLALMPKPPEELFTLNKKYLKECFDFIGALIQLHSDLRK